MYSVTVTTQNHLRGPSMAGLLNAA